MKKRNGNYPNATDFEPYFGIETRGNGTSFELPLSDPSESNANEVFWKNEMIEFDVNKPSAFSFNKDLNEKVPS